VFLDTGQFLAYILSVPTIKRFAAFTIHIYFADHNPPHVHIVGTDWQARIAIAARTILPDHLKWLSARQGHPGSHGLDGCS